MPKYYWWRGADLTEFVADIVARGLVNVRIEFHPQGKGGEDKAMLYVKGSRAADAAFAAHEGDDEEGHNHAHPCPPDCDE